MNGINRHNETDRIFFKKVQKMKIKLLVSLSVLQNLKRITVTVLWWQETDRAKTLQFLW